MPICARCGEHSPDNVTVCQKCGVAFSHQIRAREDVSRARTGKMVRGVAWLAALGVLALAGPPAYHAGSGAYFRFHLKSVRQSAMKSCGGPLLDNPSDYQKEQYTTCMASHEELLKAESDYAKFKKGG